MQEMGPSLLTAFLCAQFYSFVFLHSSLPPSRSISILELSEAFRARSESASCECSLAQCEETDIVMLF